MPRMTGCGDATGRNIARILEEQAMKRGVVRRSDIQVMSLVMDGKQVRGLTAYDTNTGEVIPRLTLRSQNHPLSEKTFFCLIRYL